MKSGRLYLYAALVVVCLLIAYYMWRHHHGGPEPFTGDIDHWPTAGTIGNLADTNPYGNYAGHASLWWPTYFEQDNTHYWSRN